MGKGQTGGTRPLMQQRTLIAGSPLPGYVRSWSDSRWWHRDGSDLFPPVVEFPNQTS